MGLYFALGPLGGATSVDVLVYSPWLKLGVGESM